MAPTGDDGQPPVLRFTGGIPGFPDVERFVLSDLTDDGTFQLLTAVHDPELSLVVTSPWLFFPDYAVDLPAGDRADLALDDPADTIVFCAAIADEDEQLHVNLRAPFVVNATTHAARQVVLDDPDLSLRAAVAVGG